MLAVYLVAGIAVLALVVFLVWECNNLLKLTKYQVCVPQLKNQTTIVHLSDLHGKAFGKGNARLLKKVAAQHPQIICFTGDSIHKYRKRDLKVSLQFFTELVKIAPVLFVSGNHEMRGMPWRYLKTQLQKIGVTVLENQTVTLNDIAFSGLNAACLKNNTLANMPTQKGVNVLLAHDPRYFERYVQKGYNLVLCGHAHGGQWRIPFTSQGLFAPGQGLFPKYCMGEYHKNDTTMIVSCGLGNSEFPLRLFNHPEVVVVTLNSK